MCVHTHVHTFILHLHVHTQHQGVSYSTQASLPWQNWTREHVPGMLGSLLRKEGVWTVTIRLICNHRTNCLTQHHLRDICSILTHHCGPEPTNSCVFKDTQLLWAFLHSSRLLSRHFKCSLPSPTPPYYAAAMYTHFSPNLESTLKKWVDL